jgi:hypothetical protein
MGEFVIIGRRPVSRARDMFLQWFSNGPTNLDQ